MCLTNKNKIEVLGLILLLIAFGWQCWHEYRQETQYKALMYEFNQQLFSIHTLVYNDVLKQDYFAGEERFKIEEGSYAPMNYDWIEIQKRNINLEKESEIAFTFRMVFYILGSVLIILSKINSVFKTSDK